MELGFEIGVFTCDGAIESSGEGGEKDRSEVNPKVKLFSIRERQRRERERE